MSNKSFKPSGQQSQQVLIQVQCVNCRATKWIRGQEALNSAGSVRWDCPRCHFNNQTSLPGKTHK